MVSGLTLHQSLRPTLSKSDADLVRRVHHDLRGDFDEELELEFDDRNEDRGADGDLPEMTNADKDARRRYFRELFGLQAELVKLQDWAVATRHKVVILCEGRDTAGKGGVITRCRGRRPSRLL
jgi:polyphosphate kinase 2 (PPK2 family)